MAGNPFKEAEERKKKEAEERARKAAEEAAKAGVVTAVEAAPVQEEPAVAVAVEEPPAAPVVQADPTVSAYESAANALREQMDANREKMEKKVPVNVMIKPSLKRKVEQDIRNKKVKSLSHLITMLLEQYYK